jgi:hypothetical protein
MADPPDYSQPINFKDLAAKNKDFDRVLQKWHGRMEWKDGESLMSVQRFAINACLFFQRPDQSIAQERL